MLASSSMWVPSALLAGQVAVGDQAVLEVEEFALDFAIGGGRLLIGPHDDHAVAAVDDHQVAAFDFAHDPVDTRDGRDAAAARRIAAWLVEPPSSVTIPAIGRSPRLMAWLGRISCATRITDSSPLRESPAGSTWLICFRRQVRLDPQDHVADVGHALAKEILLDPSELRGVAVHHDLQRRERRQLLVLDQAMDPRMERRDR